MEKYFKSKYRAKINLEESTHFSSYALEVMYLFSKHFELLSGRLGKHVELRINYNTNSILIDFHHLAMHVTKHIFNAPEYNTLPDDIKGYVIDICYKQITSAIDRVIPIVLSSEDIQHILPEEIVDISIQYQKPGLNNENFFYEINFEFNKKADLKVEIIPETEDDEPEEVYHDPVTIDGMNVEDITEICKNENNLIQLEYYGSKLFQETVLNNPRKVRYYKEIVNNFIKDYTPIKEDFNSGHLNYLKAHTEEYIRRLNDLSYKLEVVDRKTSHKAKAFTELQIAESALLFDQVFTEASIQKVANTKVDFKIMYENMVNMVKSLSEQYEDIYYPGYDKYDWKESVTEFFEENSKILFPLKSTNKYVNLMVPVCEVDFNLPLANKIAHVLEALIPTNLRVDNSMNEIGYYTIVQERPYNSARVCLASKYFPNPKK